MVTFAVKQNFFFYRHKQLQVQVMFFKIQTIEQIPGFRTPVTWNELGYTRGLPWSMIQSSWVAVRYQNTQQKPSKRLVERIQPYISTAFFPTSSLYSWWVFFPSVVYSQVSRKSYSALGRCEGFFLLFFSPPFPVSSLSLLDRTCWDPLQQPLKSRSGQGWVARRRGWHLRGKHHHQVFNRVIAIVSACSNNFGTVSGKPDNLLIFVASFCSVFHVAPLLSFTVRRFVIANRSWSGRSQFT